MIENYRTVVFDCDGVILNSNRVKTEAFRMAALPYGIEAADALVNYHVANGGVSRYDKFQYFLDVIVHGQSGPDLAALLATYAADVRAQLLKCEISDCLGQLRSVQLRQRWMVVSGSDQTELRQVFASRRLSEMFESGIFGSPDDKAIILKRELGNGAIRTPALFLGDSAYDHRVATEAGMDFIFVSAWTEFTDWQKYVSDNGLKTISLLGELMNE
jgi:phosphoglycolate phosphatase-like HAD superfamily hydrolase